MHIVKRQEAVITESVPKDGLSIDAIMTFCIEAQAAGAAVTDKIKFGIDETFPEWDDTCEHPEYAVSGMAIDVDFNSELSNATGNMEIELERIERLSRGRRKRLTGCLPARRVAFRAAIISAAALASVAGIVALFILSPILMSALVFTAFVILKEIYI